MLYHVVLCCIRFRMLVLNLLHKNGLNVFVLCPAIATSQAKCALQGRSFTWCRVGGVGFGLQHTPSSLTQLTQPQNEIARCMA